MACSLRLVAHSEIGLVRRNNQDSVYASPTLLAVADGMGGAAAGDLASAVAIKHLAQVDARYQGQAMLERLSQALADANDDLADLIVDDPERDGMGTTVCGALFSGTQLGLVHIGDSRGYLLRAGTVMQLTHDHSWVQTLIDSGELTPDEAAVHPKRSLLMKVLNGQPAHQPDLSLVDLRQGDRVMFCSDGLSGLITPEALARWLKVADADEAVRRLVAAARRAGGHDNITLVVADVVAQDDALDACEPRVLGAAAQIEVPQVPSAGGAAALVAAHGGGLDDQPLGAVGEAWWGDDGEAPDERIFFNRSPRGRLGRSPGGRLGRSPGGRLGRRRGGPGLRARSRQRGGRRWLVALIVVVAASVVLGGAVLGGRAWLVSQFYLGEFETRVAIYQGLPERFAGVELGRLSEITETSLGDLPPYYADQVRQNQIRPDSLDGAREAAGQLRQKAELCLAQREQQANRPGVSASPTLAPDAEDCA